MKTDAFPSKRKRQRFSYEHLPVMSELISQAFRLVNLPFTLLLILVVIYWLLVAVGAVGGEHARYRPRCARRRGP